MKKYGSLLQHDGLLQAESIAIGALLAIFLPTILHVAYREYVMAANIVPQTTGLVAGTILLAGALCFVVPTRKRPKAVDSMQTLLERMSTMMPHVYQPRCSREILSLTECFRAPENTPGSLDDFIKQLKEQMLQQTQAWTSRDDLDFHHSALLTMFSLHYFRMEKQYNELRDSLAIWARNAGRAGDCLDTSTMKSVCGAGVEQARLLVSLQESSYIANLSSRHAFATTLLMGALEQARESVGVLPESDFGWLMDVDRTLALALNSVGRPSYLPQVLGVSCHYMAEKRAQHCLHEPHVIAGARGLVEFHDSKDIWANGQTGNSPGDRD